MSESTEEIAIVRSLCGRYCLLVKGIVVAMQGDPCRDPDIPDFGEWERSYGYASRWGEQELRYAADRINGKIA